jgi:hypothetical protein
MLWQKYNGHCCAAVFVPGVLYTSGHAENYSIPFVRRQLPRSYDIL